MRRNHRAHSVVVGGTRGIGRAVVAKLAKRGDALSILSRRPPENAPEEKDGPAYFQCDLLDRKKLERVLGKAVGARGPVANLVFLQRWRGEGDDWEAELSTTLTGTRNAMRALEGRFAAASAVVMVNSSASHFIAGEQTAGYHAARGGLTQMMRYCAATLAPRGIRVNGVSFGTVLKHESRAFYEKQRKLTNLYKKIIPLGRLGMAEDVANAIAFLCSEEASFITGQNLMIDGGLSLQWHESLARQAAGLGGASVTRKGRTK